MTQGPLHLALLAAGAVLLAGLLMIPGCSKPGTISATATTRSAATAQLHPTLTPPPPPPPAVSAASDLGQTAAVSPPGGANGQLPPTPGERETLASARQDRPR